MLDTKSSPVPAEAEAAEVRPAVESEAQAPDPVPLPENAPEPSAASGQDASRKAAQQDEHKESTMIDVHAPHGGLHTWKDFWIHLGTITLGLLIAISLEQSVEWLHHLHQRHQLEADLHAEAERNIAIMDDDYSYFDASMAQIAANRDRVDAMRAGGGRVKLSYLPFKNPHASGVGSTAPLASVWTTAEESELVALLPREEAGFYDRVYRQQETYRDFNERLQEVGVEVRSFDVQFTPFPKVPSDPIYPDLSLMSAAQLDEESALLAKLWMATNMVRLRLDIFYSAETAVLHGGSSDQDVMSHYSHHPVTLLPAQPEAPASKPGTQKPEKP